MFMLMIIGVVTMLVSWFVSNKLKNKFQEYSQIGLRSGLSGADAAARMLKDNNIYDVKILSVDGQLSDHYNPANKTVNLSHDVYHGRSAASVAVAAHECGHAVQHATAYSMIQLRSKLVPVVKIGSTLSQWVIIAGLGMLGFGGGNSTVLLIGIILFATTTLFSVITLPVEFDATNRALKWLNTANITTPQEHEGAKDALKWAALTYVVSALASIAMLVQYLLIYMSRSNDD